MKYLNDIAESLKNANISFYKIAQLIDEPESTIQNIFKGHNKYSDDKVKTILDKIKTYLSEPSEVSDIQDPELFIKLYALGLDSKVFTPEEKYKLAVAYKKLTDSKTQ